MSDAFLIFFAAQTVSIIGSIFIAYMKIQVTIAKLKSQNMSIQLMVDSLKSDYKDIGGKVDGIIRHVAIIEGMELERERTK